MGVRIYAYAVDISRLATILESSLAELLCRYSRDGNDPDERFTVIDDDTWDTFVATPHGAMTAALTDESGRRRLVLTESEIQAVPFLQRTASDHLTSGSIYQSKWFFQAFSNCAGINCIRRLIDGHRRWWIGSVLQLAKEALPSGDYDKLEHLFRQILRGLNCGFQIPQGDPGFTAAGLPFTPPNDPDLRFGRWSEDDSSLAVALLSKIVSSSPVLTRPPGPIGIAPDDSQWHEWVSENVTSLLHIPDADGDVCNVLTFIG